MPKAITNYTPANRRRIADIVAAASILSIVTLAHASAAHPDAELIRLCARHDVLERQYRGLFDTIADDDERGEQLSMIEAVQDELLPRLLKLEAATYDGLMARVRTMCLNDTQVAPAAIDALATSVYSNEKQMAALVRDLTAHAGVVV